MKRTLIFAMLIALVSGICCSENKITSSAFEEQAKRVTIIRDEYGIPHIYGKTDADCVFGLMYAQCEDDFARVEDNYLTNLGRRSEAYGEENIFEDLLIKLTIDSAEAVEDYKASPEWLKKLLNAYADGINYYLEKHPDVKPLVLKKFEPWFPLMYTDGSISALQTGGLRGKDLQAFYASKELVSNLSLKKEENLIGSNGFAISPSKSTTGKALFYINPHVTFYFRPEVHMQSEEGLHVYGAVTWGQFFVYQGFNESLGFMHTSSGADVADLYAETVTRNADGKYEYKYNDTTRPVDEYKVAVSFDDNGTMKTKTFTTYATHHGPVLAMLDGKWLSLKTKNRSLKGLIQSWERIKARSIGDFTTVLNYRSNLSNNTVYADREGNIAYWHGNYMPRRDSSYNWEMPVDGSIGKTEWKGMHEVKELVQVVNPKNGWIQNTNNTPYSVSGKESPQRKNYPAYMAPDAENFRGLNAVRVLSSKDKFSLEDLITVGYDPHLTAFDTSMPVLIKAHELIKDSNKALYDQLSEQIAVLKAWDRNASESSIATTLGIYWAEEMNKLLGSDDPELFGDFTEKYGRVLRGTEPLKLLNPLKQISDSLTVHFGTWKMPWGEVNRMQRIQGGVKSVHDDAKASIPVGRVSSTWGMLPAFASRTFGTKKRYGFGGNSFVCAVEFGDKIRAKSILAGGESGDPRSAHFFDQSNMYAGGKFKDVLFYKEDVLKHAKRTYHPGE